MNDITFKNEFDLTSSELSQIVIKENYKNDNCFIWDANDNTIAYNSLILTKNSRSKIVCEISFFKSSITHKYIPRLTFKRLLLDNSEQSSRNPLKVTIPLNDSVTAQNFWRLISFLDSYKDLVDTGEFNQQYKVVPKETFIIKFKNKNEKQKLDDLKELINIAELSSNDLKFLTYENRKQNLKAFYYLLTNKTLRNGFESHSFYRKRYDLREGEEYIWHHFLKKNDWILGLNIDLKFVIEFLDEQKIGFEDSKGAGSPQTDLLGISEFTTLVELKHTTTNIFKIEKSKGRANTWDFTSHFIEGVSQCLGQKFELDKSFDQKQFIKEDLTLLDKCGIQSVDPQSILLIGNKKREFPINTNDRTNLIKNKTLQRFRRNTRNIDVLTYDELFERAYHIVFSRKLDKDWYWKNEEVLFDE